MKITKRQLRQLIKEGFMDYFKGALVPRAGKDMPAMDPELGFNQGPSSNKFKLVDAMELGFRKRAFLRSLDYTREAIGGSIESYFSDPSVKIDLSQLKDDIKSDISGIDARGYVYAPTDMDLAFPGPIENTFTSANPAVSYIGNPMQGWQLISKYLSGEINRLPVKSRDLFAVQQAYATRQLGL